MSSLWTPQGEHKVPRSGAAGGGSPGSGAPDGGGGGAGGGPAGAGGDGDPERGGEMAGGGGFAAEGEAGELDEEAVRAELAALQEQIASAPAVDVIANHAYGLFELAAVHLSRRPPNLDEARLAIDALGGIADALGERLGQHAAGLRDGLAQIRLAYVQIATLESGEPGTAEAQPPTEGD